MLLLPLSTLLVVNMEQVNFGHSLKNIPIPTKKEYLLELVSSVGTFISNLRWRSHFFLNPSDQTKKESYGFKTTKVAPGVPDLTEFESGLHDLVKSVKFKPITTSNLQNTMKRNIQDIKKETKMYVAADKTTNFYKVEKDEYNELLNNNITKEYKKAKDAAVKKLNNEDKAIAKQLEIEDKVYSLSKREAFVTMKDHKDNFMNNPKCRLINPTKSELGKVSKQILTKIVTALRMKTKMNSWKNTHSVIEWFEKLENKKNLVFIQFDIVEFYPSISEELLKKALEYAKGYIKITAQDIKIILQTKKAFLFNSDQPWIKKGNKTFDVTMGSYDGAEVCDLVGLYLLSQLGNLDLLIGLYRDDGLAVSNLGPRQTEMRKKRICKIFKENRLNITTEETNGKKVNFLDVNFDLENGLYRPYMKKNNKPLYVHMQSNHPLNILENIPKSVNNRLSSISSNENVFNEECGPYQLALQESGYTHKLKYSPKHQQETNKRNRTRRTTWFNPPFSKNIQTNLGQKFLQLIDKCFPPNHPLYRVVNRNTVKISYRCMPNIGKIISSHNKSILKTEEVVEPVNPGCNCGANMDPCPMEGGCLVNNVVYKATVTDQDSKVETYTGLTGSTFKKRYHGHTHSFRHRNSKTSTTLSSHIWSLRDQNKNFDLGWEVIDRASTFNPISKKCQLCLKEKYYILFQPEGATLNRRSELFSTCRHRLRQLLGNT